MEEKSILQVGGSIEKALKGEYQINVKSVLNEAWDKTKQSRIAINLGLGFSLGLGVIISMIFMQYNGGFEAVFNDQPTIALLNILITLLIYPFLVGVEMMGIFHAVGLQTKSKLVFAFLRRGSWVALCALISSTLVSLGFTLFYLPGIYLGMALSLVLPLVVEKRLSPISAIVLSLKATRFQWGQLLAIYAILTLMLIAAFLPMVVLSQSSAGIVGGVMTIFALSYLAPLFYNVKGILYREIFGMQLSVTKGQTPSTGDATFTA